MTTILYQKMKDISKCKQRLLALMWRKQYCLNLNYILGIAMETSQQKNEPDTKLTNKNKKELKKIKIDLLLIRYITHYDS